MRVAIAEDDEASCKLLQAYLKTYSEKTGVVFEIDCFPDGMKLVNAYKPVYDLLLLDIEMPLLDGMSAARRADARGFGEQRHGFGKCVLVKIVLHFQNALRFDVIRGPCRLNGFHFHRISLLRFVLRTV